MLHQPIDLTGIEAEPAFRIENAPRAPVPGQVAMPDPVDGDFGYSKFRLAITVAANIVGGGLFLVALLAAPVLAGRLLGLG